MFNDVDQPDNARHLRALASIALVPKDHVEKAYKALFDSDFWTSNMECLEDLLDYFEKTWLGRSTRRGYVNPLFPSSVWNQHDGVLGGLPRTNNALEGWHNAFVGRAGCNHPTIWRLIDLLKAEHSLIALNLTHIDTGVAPPPPRRRYREANMRLKNVLEAAKDSWTDSTSEDTYQYLLNVSSIIHYN